MQSLFPPLAPLTSTWAPALLVLQPPARPWPPSLPSGQVASHPNINPSHVQVANGAGHGGLLGRDRVGGRIRPAIPRLHLTKASRRRAGLTQKPEPGDTLCERCGGAFVSHMNLSVGLCRRLMTRIIPLFHSPRERSNVAYTSCTCNLWKDPAVVQLSMPWSAC